MKHYMKPASENNLDVIVHVGTNELDCKGQPKMIAKFIIKTSICTVSISGIVKQNGNSNNGMDINEELSKMCREAK